MRIKFAFLGLALMLCYTPSMAQGAPKFKVPKVVPLPPQPSPPPNPQNNVSIPHPPLPAEELRAIFGDANPRPGIYRVAPVHNSQFCLNPGMKHGVGDILAGSRIDVLSQSWCPPTPSNNAENYSRVVEAYFLAIFPSPNNGYSIRRVTGVNNFNDGTYNYCATIARGVVFGPSSIDFLPCESQNSNPLWVAADQSFTFENLGNSIFKIHTANNECFDVRDASFLEGAETIRWGCNNNDNQKFKLTYIRDFAQGAPKTSVLGQGYVQAFDGIWRNNPVPNISFTSTPYVNKISVRDLGAQCRQECLNDTKCVSWVYDYSDEDNDPLCQLRKETGTPYRARLTLGGSIRN